MRTHETWHMCAQVLGGLLGLEDCRSSLVRGALVTLYYLGADKNHIQVRLPAAKATLSLACLTPSHAQSCLPEAEPCSVSPA